MGTTSTTHPWSMGCGQRRGLMARQSALLHLGARLLVFICPRSHHLDCMMFSVFPLSGVQWFPSWPMQASNKQEISVEVRVRYRAWCGIGMHSCANQGREGLGAGVVGLCFWVLLRSGRAGDSTVTALGWFRVVSRQHQSDAKTR